MPSLREFSGWDDDGEELSEHSDDPEGLQSSDSDESEDERDEEEDEEDGVGSEGGDNPSLSVKGTSAEIEIEGDFHRLVENIRLTNGTQSGAGKLTKEWDFSIEEKDAEFRDDLRAASGIGRQKKKRGRRVGPVLSQEVCELLGAGNQAYVESNIPETIRIMQEVIRIEPRASSAWSVLAQCYGDLNEPDKALQLRIMAAHLNHDAEEWDRLARQSKELGFNQQALYCYRKVYSLDPTNVDALWDRATLAKSSGDLRTARNALVAILKRFPHDLTVLGELRPVLIELSDLNTCASLFQQAFEHHQRMYSSGRGFDPESSTEMVGGGFGLMEVLVLADLYNTLGEHERAITVIRQGCRWLQGRMDQKYWDMCEDDREYDLTVDGRVPSRREGEVQPGLYPLDVNARHRLAVARIKMGEVDEGKMHANFVLSQEVLDYAPLFVEIADAYFERELYAEARPIYELLGTDASTSSLYVLLQTAACLRMIGELREAAEVYEHVKSADPSHNEAKMKLAEIYEILNEPRKALELVYEVIDSRKKRTGPREGEDSDHTGGVPNASLFEERSRGKTKSSTAKVQNRLTAAQLRELEEEKEREVLRGYRKVTDLWPTMLSEGETREEAEREWLFEAEKLVDTFRETRNLFLTSRNNPFRGMFPRHRIVQRNEEANEDRMATRLHLDLGTSMLLQILDPNNHFLTVEHDSTTRKSKGGDKHVVVNSFRGVSFKNWLKVFVQYAFILTQRNQYDVADEVLRHILLSNAYQSRTLQDTLRIALLTCAVATQRYTVVVEQCRKLIGHHQFNNEPQRILMAALASGLRPTDSFIMSTLQKHLFREMKLGDAAVKNKDSLKWNPLNRRYAPTSAATSNTGEGDDAIDDDVEDIVGEVVPEETPIDKISLPAIPTKDNPLPVAIYGQICTAAKSYQSAIFHLLHAFDYCPEDPMICLCLAIASIGRAMQRQSDNRQHLIAQGMAFLSLYRNIRGTSAEGIDEVEYNFGRAFQQLGLYSYAVRHYERVLESAATRTEDDPGFAREAAYNLSLIFVMTGATPLAKALYQRWLSV